MTQVWKKTKDHRIKKRGLWYWARYEKQGREICESLGTQSFDTAKRVADEMESCVLLGIDWRKEQELFETAWPEFLIAKAQGNKTRLAREKTLKEYEGFGHRYFMPHFKDLRLTELESAWDKMVEDVRKKKPKMLFFNPRKYLMGFCRWAKVKGKIREMPHFFDPDAKNRAEREEVGPGKAYTLDELKRLRDAAKKHEGFYLFMLMAQYMGMRPSEITQLKKDRIDFEKGVITLRKADTKTHRARLVPIHPEVKDLLDARLGAFKSAYLFPNRSDSKRPMDKTGFKKVWAKVLSEAKLDGHIYDFRHTFITHALMSGVRIDAVAMVTGTSIVVIQKHYLHLEPSHLVQEIGKVSL